MAVGAICVFGILVFIPLLLRFVSAELKIAKGWAEPRTSAVA
jgi:hypothetical protein